MPMPNRLKIKIIGNNGPGKKIITEVIKKAIDDAGYNWKSITHEPDITLEVKPPSR